MYTCYRKLDRTPNTPQQIKSGNKIKLPYQLPISHPEVTYENEASEEQDPHMKKHIK